MIEFSASTTSVPGRTTPPRTTSVKVGLRLYLVAPCALAAIFLPADPATFGASFFFVSKQRLARRLGSRSGVNPQCAPQSVRRHRASTPDARSLHCRYLKVAAQLRRSRLTAAPVLIGMRSRFRRSGCPCPWSFRPGLTGESPTNLGDSPGCFSVELRLNENARSRITRFAKRLRRLRPIGFSTDWSLRPGI